VDGLRGRGLAGSPFRGVRDFIDVYFEPLFGIDHHFPAFNLADSCITVGRVRLDPRVVPAARRPATPRP
jgi:hypothetical protein